MPNLAALQLTKISFKRVSILTPARLSPSECSSWLSLGCAYFGVTGCATLSTVLPTLERRTPDMSLDTPSPSSQLLKPQRVLACVICQQRKVKCDRKFPCANCIKSQAQCVPATLAQRRRRRRFPERMLLERLRKYEDLLRQHNITFEPLHKDSAREGESLNAQSGYDSDNEHPETVGPDLSTPSTPVKSERGYEAK